LLHLRDLYAPNVKLAFHISNWATLHDVGLETDPALDVAALGVSAGQFAGLNGAAKTPPGTSSYDLVFNDVSDRDAGYYSHVFGRSGSWWDRTNQTLPTSDAGSSTWRLSQRRLASPWSSGKFPQATSISARKTTP